MRLRKRFGRTLAIVLTVAVLLYVTGPDLKVTWRDAIDATPGASAVPFVYAACRPGAHHVAADPRLCVTESSSAPFYDAEPLQGSPAAPGTTAVPAVHGVGLYLAHPAVRLFAIDSDRIAGFGVRDAATGVYR